MVAIAGKGWSLAPCLRAMFDEADRRWPARSRVSDGSVGDLSHSARASDHNPDSSGDVLAGDLTHDPANGCDARLFAEHLRVSRDPRVKYVISAGKMFASYSTSARPAWTWGQYTGVNAHEKHTHVSVLDTDAAKGDTSPWFSYADAPDPALEEDDMPLSDTDKQWIHDEVVSIIVGLGVAGAADPRNPAATAIIGEIRKVPEWVAANETPEQPGAAVTAEEIADELAARLQD